MHGMDRPYFIFLFILHFEMHFSRRTAFDQFLSLEAIKVYFSLGKTALANRALHSA